jgi:hypothetical protein
MSDSRSRKRIAKNLYERDGRYIGQVTVEGRLRFKTLDARNPTEAKKRLAELQADASRARSMRAIEA